MEKYHNRQEAGQILAEQMKKYKNAKDTLVLGLPRGGIPVAYEVAKILSLPLDTFIVRKLGMPGHEELALGAIATNGVIVFNQDILWHYNIAEKDIEPVITREKQELQRRERAYRGDRAFPELNNKSVILVDDGIATGATMRAAVEALRQQNPKKIIIAVPVAAADTCEQMIQIADEVVCPLQPQFFYAVGAWYEHFDQTSDKEVTLLLQKANQN